MQQLAITLIALLGLFAPTANIRVAKFFVRFVPPMSSGRVACEGAALADTGTPSGQQQGCPASGGQAAPRRTMVSQAIWGYVTEGEQQAARDKRDSLQRRVRRAQRAARCRFQLTRYKQVPAAQPGFFLFQRLRQG